MASAAPAGAIVHLNVGGTVHTTTLPTLLRSSPGSLLHQMFSGQQPVVPDGEGCYFIDRDGALFHHVLNFLRDGSLPLGLNQRERLELLREAVFYKLPDLHAALGGAHVPGVTPVPPPEQPAAPPAAQGMGAMARGHWQYARSRSNLALGGEGATGGSTGSRQVTPAPGDAPHGHANSMAMLQASVSELGDFAPKECKVRIYVRLRFGQEYSGDWIVSSPRNLPGVTYELHDACLARSPIDAMNKMSQAGFHPCDHPPVVPPVADFYTDGWAIVMYKDVNQPRPAQLAQPVPPATPGVGPAVAEERPPTQVLRRQRQLGATMVL